MKHINILGTGKSLPSCEVTADDIDRKCNLASGTSFRITGLEKRYFLKEESVVLLILKAINQALKNANLTIDDIDCIISANATMQQMIPFNAAGVHQILKPKRNIPSFDINMTCLSALRAFDVASSLLAEYKTILIVSCDIASIGLDWSDIRTAGIFGDGAAAMIVGRSDRGGIVVSNFETHSDGFEYCQIRGGGSKITPASYKGNYENLGWFEMDAKNLFKIVAKTLPKFVESTLSSKGLEMESIDWVVPHQASKSFLNHLIKKLNIDKNKVINIFKNHGNQVAVSIPTALHELFITKKLNSGDKVMLIGTSAGVGLGLVVWEVP